MDPKRIIIFIASLTLIQVLLDFYVVRSWTNYVKRHGWSAWFYRPIWFVVIVAALIFPYVSLQRSNYSKLEPWMFYALLFAYAWYLPKLPIAVVLLFNDVIGWFSWIKRIVKSTASKFIKNKVETIPKEQPVIAVDPKRRMILEGMGWSLSSIPFAIVAKGFVSYEDIQVYNQDIVFMKLPKSFDGFRIVQLSDLHAGSFTDDRMIQETRRIVDKLKPDMIVITGDFVNYQAEELKIIRNELAKFHVPYGVFGSLGNHDHYSSKADHALLRSVVKNSGVQLLVNESHVINSDGEKLQIVATDNTGLGQNFADVPAALSNTDLNYPIILLAHDPTLWDKEIKGKTPVDIMLSGHTHGGQVGVNLFGTELSVAQFVYKQWAGLYSENEQHLYVNRGLGTVGPPIRIGIPPEITHITLRRATNLT